MRTPHLVAGTVACALFAPACFAGTGIYDMSALLAQPFPFANTSWGDVWPNPGPVHLTLPPSRGTGLYDMWPLLKEPYPFASGPRPAQAAPPAAPAPVARTPTAAPAMPAPPAPPAPVQSSAPPPLPRAAVAPSASPSAEKKRAAPPLTPAEIAAEESREEGAIPKRLYLGGAGGLALLQDADNSGSGLAFTSTYNPGFTMSGVAGLQFDSGLRLEFELAYRQVAVDKLQVTQPGSLGIPTGSVQAKGDVGVMAMMFNAGWEFRPGWPFRPFVLAGFGPARVAVSGVKTASGISVTNDSATVVAGQLGLGATFNLTDHWLLDAAYRFFITIDPTLRDTAGNAYNSQVMAHDFLFGARYLF